MSRFCIGIINLQSLKECKNIIINILEENNLACFFEFDYIEPFLKKYINEEKQFFSISDNKDFDNCEIFLLPDNCYFNGIQNHIPFDKRMGVLVDISNEILKSAEKIEFFIGDSGASFDEFENLDVNINSFKSNLLQKVNDYNCKDLHFIVRTDC